MPRRLTPAAADALVAHLSAAERRRRIDVFIAAMAIHGIAVRELYEAVTAQLPGG